MTATTAHVDDLRARTKGHPPTSLEPDLDSLPGVPEALAAIDATLAEATSRASSVKALFMDGATTSAIEVQEAELEAERATLEAERARTSLRSEASARRVTEVDDLVATYADELVAHDAAVAEANAALTEAAAALLSATDAHNATLAKARRELRGAVVALPDGSEVPRIGDGLLLAGRRWEPAHAGSSQGRSGLLNGAVKQAEHHHALRAKEARS